MSRATFGLDELEHRVQSRLVDDEDLYVSCQLLAEV